MNRRCNHCGGKGTVPWHGNGKHKPPTSHIPCRECRWADYKAIFPDARRLSETEGEKEVNNE